MTEHEPEPQFLLAPARCVCGWASEPVKPSQVRERLLAHEQEVHTLQWSRRYQK